MCDIIGYDDRGKLLGPLEDFRVAPRTHVTEARTRSAGIGECSSPVRGRDGAGASARVGREPVTLHPPGEGFGDLSVGRGWNDLARGHSVLGTVSDRAARAGVHTATGIVLEAVVVRVPEREGAMKAFVAFTPYDEAPWSIVALDEAISRFEPVARGIRNGSAADRDTERGRIRASSDQDEIPVAHVDLAVTATRRTLDQICTLKIWMRPTMIRYAATK